MKNLLKLSAITVIVTVLSGCFFFGTKREPPITYEELEEKQRVEYAASYEKVWDAALAALTSQKIEEVDKESGIITTRETNVSASKMDDYAWSPSYGSFWYYMNSGAMDDARYWINIKVSEIAADTTRVQITPNFEVHIREWTWDTTSAMVWKRVRSRGVIEDFIAEKIADGLE